MNFNIKKPWRNQNHRSPFNRELNKSRQAILQDLVHGEGIHVEHTKAGTVVFDNGMAVLPNDSRADEIHAELRTRERHPDHYALVKNREGRKRDALHRYRITNPGLPWNKYDQFGRKVTQ